MLLSSTGVQALPAMHRELGPNSAVGCAGWHMRYAFPYAFLCLPMRSPAPPRSSVQRPASHCMRSLTIRVPCCWASERDLRAAGMEARPPGRPPPTSPDTSYVLKSKGQSPVLCCLYHAVALRIRPSRFSCARLRCCWTSERGLEAAGMEARRPADHLRLPSMHHVC